MNKQDAFPDYRTLTPLQQQVVDVSMEHLRTPEEIVGACEDASTMDAVECRQHIAAFTQ